MAYINFGSNTERVKNLQEMLRTLANLTGKAEYNVAADGNFDAATRRAVSDFQREHGLTVTGVPDNATWDILRREVYAAERESGEGLPIDPFSGNFRPIEEGEYSELVLLVQIILRELDIYHDFDEYIPLSGKLDRATMASLSQFQEHAGLDVTGEIDLPTWNRLALEYGNITAQ